MNKGQLIFALDPNDSGSVRALLDELSGIVQWIKIGFQAYSALGTNCVQELKEEGYKIFTDFKFHDIPSTVARDVRNMTERGANMINMHAAGGIDMMLAARESAEKSASENDIEKPILLGVTVLTSMNEGVFQGHPITETNLKTNVVYLAKEVKSAGLPGVCASPLEIEPIRETCGDDFLIVTPGIRPVWATQDDQQRTATPSEAIKRGANYIVVGRPILASKSPRDAALRIIDEIENA